MFKTEKGFTLIELLATIVILGLLALIVTPGVAKVIRNSKINTAKASLEGYIREVENAVALYMTDTGNIPNSIDHLEIDGKNISKIGNPNVVFNNDGTISKITATVNDFKCAYIENNGVTCYEDDVVPTLSFNDKVCNTTLTSISDIDSMNSKLDTCVESPIGEITYTGSIGKKSGDYVINYSAEDEFGNTDTLSKTFTVNITLSIEFDIAKCNTTLTSADAINTMNSNLNSCINASGTVSHTGTIGNTNGTYDIVYTVTDAYENTNTLTKTFKVEITHDTALGNYGDPVYYNPVSDTLECTEYDLLTQRKYSTSGVVEGCLKWHVLSENEDGSVNLILDHNIVSGVKWHETENTSGPAVAKEALNNAIKDKWSANLVRTDSYTHTFNNGTEDITYTVNYSGMKARLPEAWEIANAVGYTTFDETSKSSNTISFNEGVEVGIGKPSDYAWLYNNTESSNNVCQIYGCEQNYGNSSGDQGYWTSTAVAGSSNRAWLVSMSGSLSKSVWDKVGTTSYGIRPVITLNAN